MANEFPKLKPLIWCDLHGDGSLYQTRDDLHPIGYHAIICNRGRLGFEYSGTFYRHIEGAMSAANGDYRAKILSLFE